MRETVDLRAYRIADRKQHSIRQVEALLRDNAMDCDINLSRLHFDRDALGIKVDLVTSQGIRVHGHRVGDDPRSQPRCSFTHKGRQPWDTSTYDVRSHAFHMHSYRRLLRDTFGSHGNYKATFRQVWEHVRGRFPGAREDLLALALDDMVREGHEVMDTTGRRGKLLYRGSAYVFQPAGAPTEFLTDRERRADNDPKARRIDLVIGNDVGNDGTSAAPRKDAHAHAQSPLSPEWKLDAADAVLRVRVDAWLERMPSSIRIGVKGIEEAALDAVIDRLNHHELMRCCVSVLTSRAMKNATDMEKRILRALERAGIADLKNGVIRSPVELEAAGGDPLAAGAYLFDTRGHGVRKCTAQELATAVFAPTAIRPDGDVDAAVQPSVKHGGRAIFKVIVRNIAVAGPSRGGCVCAQTSTITTALLSSLVASLAVGATKIDQKVIAKTDKKVMCDVYETILRAMRPDRIVRPIDVPQWQRMHAKGARRV